jgi:uncharacterized protein (TIGR02266 family)
VAVHVPPRIFRRVPFATAVRLQFDRFRGFVEEYSANLSLGGMFIRTDQPAAVGTEVPIEFRLGADYELITGRGRVVWAREEAVDDEHPAGMGIRFLELTPGSRELIFKLVERRVREGGDPFDLEHEADLLPDRPPEPGPAPEHAVAVPPEATEEPLPAPPLEGGAAHRDEPELAPLELSAPRPDGGWSDEGGGEAADGEALPSLEDWNGEPVAWTEGGGAEDAGGAGGRGGGGPEVAGWGGGNEAVRVAQEGERLGSGEPSPAGADGSRSGAQHDGAAPHRGTGSPVDERGGAAAPAAEKWTGAAGPAIATEEQRGAQDEGAGAAAPIAAGSAATAGVASGPAGPGSAAPGELGAGPADDAAAKVFGGAPASQAGTGDPPAAADEERWVTPFGGQGAASGDASGDAEMPRWQDPPEAEAEAEAGWSGGSWTEAPAAAPDPPGGEWSSAETAAPAAGPAPGTGYAAGAPPSRLRRVLVWLLPLTAIVVLAAGWWLLGSPLPGGDGQAAPAAGEASSGTAPGGAAPAGDVGSDAGTSAVDPADVEGLGADGVVRTPPGPAAADAAAPPEAATSADGGADAGEPGEDGSSPAEPAGAGPSASEPPAAGPLTAVREVTWTTGGGRTVLTVRGDGSIPAAAVSDFRIEGDEPRHVVRLRGVTEPLSPGSLEVGSPQVRRVRAGLHADRSPSELHLVLDLAGPAVRVTGVEPAGGGLRIVVEGAP